MAKEVAIGKRLKISKAQENMVLAVLGASVVLGIAASLTVHFFKQISFNGEVIGEQDKSISAYSTVIKSVGICKQPNGNNYTVDELVQCDPTSIELSEIPGTLRAEILQNLAANEALNSVSRIRDTSCLNPKTGKDYTYKELNEVYSSARGSDELQAASGLIKSCSALRIIPDALPYFRNEEALLASLNKIYLVSNWEPESISSSGAAGYSGVETDDISDAPELNSIEIGTKIEADSGVVMSVLNNIERSIREFDITSAKLEWAAGALDINMSAKAYYVNQATIEEDIITLKAEEGNEE